MSRIQEIATECFSIVLPNVGRAIRSMGGEHSNATDFSQESVPFLLWGMAQLVQQMHQFKIISDNDARMLADLSVNFAISDALKIPIKSFILTTKKFRDARQRLLPVFKEAVAFWADRLWSPERNPIMRGSLEFVQGYNLRNFDDYDRVDETLISVMLVEFSAALQEDITSKMGRLHRFQN